MKCERVEEMLSDYLDNSLEVADREKVKAHLAECQKCASYLNTMTKTDNLIKLKIKEGPSKEYWDSYWSRLKSRLETTSTMLQPDSFPSKNRNPFHHFVPRLAFALNGVLVVLLVFTGSLLYRNTQQMKLLRITLSEKLGETEYPETAAEVFLPVTSKQAIEGSIRKQAKLFQEVSEMFPHTIKWVVTNDGEIEMGVGSRGPLEKAVVQEQVPIFLQFEIFCTSPVSKTVSSPKIMVLSGNEVNVKLTGLSRTDETIYQYRCLSVLRADGKVGLTVSISLDNSVLDTSLIINEGESIRLGSLRKGNTEYSVYVTVRSKGLNMVETGSRGI